MAEDTGFLTARIDLQGLEHDLNTFKEKLDGWSDAIVRKTEAEKVQHVREMQKLSGIGFDDFLYVYFNLYELYSVQKRSNRSRKNTMLCLNRLFSFVNVRLCQWLWPVVLSFDC